MSKPKILCFGEVLWDCLPSGAKPGGAPMNVAIHLNKLGLKPVFISRVGNDSDGRKLADFIRKSGLDTNFLQTDPELPTSKVIVKLDNRNNATYEICYPVAWDNIIVDETFPNPSSFDIIIFGTLAGRDTVTRNTIIELLQYDSYKFLDINLRPPFDQKELVEEFMYRADFVKLNDQELVRVAEWSGQQGNGKKLIQWFSKKYDLKSICVTRGEKGAILLWNEKFYEHPGFIVKVADTVGAGDAFLAGWIVAFTKNLPPEVCLEFACATGALVASHQGATPDYTIETVKNIIAKKNI